MKTLLTLLATAMMIAGSYGADKKYTEGSCCDKAKKASKECEHKCCIEAEKKGEVCKKCNK